MGELQATQADSGPTRRRHTRTPGADDGVRVGSAVSTQKLLPGAYLYSGGGDTWTDDTRSREVGPRCPFPKRSEAKYVVRDLGEEIVFGQWLPASAEEVAQRVAAGLGVPRFEPGDPRMKLARAVPLVAMMALHGRHVFTGDGEDSRFRFFASGKGGTEKPYDDLRNAIGAAFTPGWAELLVSPDGDRVRHLLEVNEQFTASGFDPSTRETSNLIREGALSHGVEAWSELPAFGLAVGVATARYCEKNGIPLKEKDLKDHGIDPLAIAMAVRSRLLMRRVGLPLLLAFRDRLQTCTIDYGQLELVREGHGDRWGIEDHGVLDRTAPGDPAQSVPLLLCFAQLAYASPDDKLSVLEKTVVAGTHAVHQHGLFHPVPALTAWNELEIRRQALPQELADLRASLEAAGKDEGHIRRQCEMRVWERLYEVL